MMGAPEPTRGGYRTSVLVAVGLVAVVALLYARTIGFGFINYDDDEYVYRNPHVVGGLNWPDLGWAFGHAYASNWHPLTWVSHQLDWELYGDWAGGHHLTSAGLHAAAAVVLFLALRRLTGDERPSGFAAAVFAAHPLHAESVAWVAERKDVLSGLFFALTLRAYAGYAHRPSAPGYLAVAALFSCGLLAKPMLVTLPCVLLLLDYWPLGRIGTGPGTGWREAVLEKVPLFALSAASAAATVAAQQAGGSVQTAAAVAFDERLSNALVSYVMYVVQSVWPINATVFYPHPVYCGNGTPLWAAAGAALLLAGVTALAVSARRRHPYVLVGWLWYLGMLVPVIGLVQVGVQARADRYTYLPQTGLAIALGWSAAANLSPARARAAGVVVLLVLAVLACRQVGYWRDSETLFRQNLDVARPNWVSDMNYGVELSRQERFEEALPHLRRACEFAPDNPFSRKYFTLALLQLGDRFARQGRMREAAGCFEEALGGDPESAQARRQLAQVAPAVGLQLARQGRPGEAAGWFRRAAELDPNSPAVFYNLGRALADAGRPAEAAASFRRVLELDPANAPARTHLERLSRTASP